MGGYVKSGHDDWSPPRSECMHGFEAVEGKLM